ncbi:MAG: DNA/RNA nuclease SfsA [Desulfobacter postgatei]|uniref:Sugar fermentation stimulation protein homolog n=1 Tax=Desulfobacter postgatei TaxID=2293 RepID=A0A2G6MT44_9BACT|nr:MAG: DNA/RNA nuclease SfsA [Desulfobacter postgatei]
MYKGYELPPLIKGKLVKRYKRFLADIELETGEVVTAHCPNSGSMKGCAQPGAEAWVSQSTDPKRKLKYTWELTRIDGTFIGINTLVPNRLVRASVEHKQIPELSDYDRVTSEVKTSAHTRLDLMLENNNKKPCFVEIKNCTLVENGVAMFPDAVTKRGQKHIQELAALSDAGHRTVLFFLVQRTDAHAFTPAADIDPEYAAKLMQAQLKGVEIIVRDVAFDLDADPAVICLDQALELV